MLQGKIKQSSAHLTIDKQRSHERREVIRFLLSHYGRPGTEFGCECHVGFTATLCSLIFHHIVEHIRAQYPLPSRGLAVEMIGIIHGHRWNRSVLLILRCDEIHARISMRIGMAMRPVKGEDTENCVPASVSARKSYIRHADCSFCN